MDIGSWLRGLGLERYEQALLDNEVDALSLPHLTSDDLREIGVTAVGHRRRFLDAIARLDHGTPDPPQETAPAPTKPLAEAERRQLTVLFCDLVGSTALSSQLDPEDMREVIRAYQDACAGVIVRFEGFVAKFMGDGVLAYFGYPRAHEDEAERAVRAGLALNEVVGKLQAPSGELLAARVGIATGLVVVGDLVGEGAAQEQAVVGDTPNLAARLQDLAQPGQVVIAERTRWLIGAGFDLTDLGPQALKGLAEPVTAFAVLAERAVASRFEAQNPAVLPMVGRDQELALLRERWAQAKSGEGQVVLLVGEAGIGKSRITRGLLDALADEPHSRVRYQCSPYHTDSALWPVIQQLTHASGITTADRIDTKLDKLEALLGGAGDAAAAPLIADLLGLDDTRYGAQELTPQIRRERTLEALVDQLVGLAARQPVLVVLEDAHWIDPTTLELIEETLDCIVDARVVVVITSRPENQPALTAHPHMTRLTLNRLARAGVEAIVARLGGEHLPGAMIDAIIARTDGVPLFVEELTKAILETGEATIPASLHDSLMARLDRLPEVKEVAQIAACIGRDFEHRLLLEVAELPEGRLRAALDTLAAAELVFRRGLAPAARYTFKHALVRDAAYESLLRTRRGAVHRRIAAALEARVSGEDTGSPGMIAQHLTAAGDLERAIGFWTLAADQARARYANREAVVSYDQALGLLVEMPESDERNRRERDIRVASSRPRLVGEGYTAPTVERNAHRIVELARIAGDDANLWPALYELTRYAAQRTDFRRARTYAMEMIRVGERIGDTRAIVGGIYAAATAPFLRGDLEAAWQELVRGTTLKISVQDQLQADDHFQAVIGCHSHAALVLYLLGQGDQARHLAEGALRQARQLDRPFALAFALQRTAIFWQLEHAVEAASEIANAFVGLQAQYPAPHWLPWLLIIRSWCAMRQDRPRAAVADLDEAWPLYHQRRSEFLGPYFRCLAAEVHLALGHIDQTNVLLEEAFELSASTDQQWWDAELHRARAALSLAQAPTNRAEAERSLQAAIQVARRQSAKSLELRAAYDLARLWAERGDRRRAYDLLAPIYGWFTEGFDTSDLKNAKALLDELA